MTNIKDIKDIMDKNAKDRTNIINQLKAVSVSRLEPIIPKMPSSVTNPAKWTYVRLCEYIQNFESNLDDEHEIGARLVSFGSEITFHIQDIGYYGPDIVTFYGVNDNGENIQLIQNISQLSILLVAVKKLKEKAERIGFRLDKYKEERK